MGVWVRIWNVILATLALAVGAFISIARWGTFTTRTAAPNTQYHNALVAITDDLKLEQKPDAEDLNILTPSESHQVTQGLRSEEQAIKRHPKETALFVAVAAIALDSLVPSAMAEHGC